MKKLLFLPFILALYSSVPAIKQQQIKPPFIPTYQPPVLVRVDEYTRVWKDSAGMFDYDIAKNSYNVEMYGDCYIKTGNPKKPVNLSVKQMKLKITGAKQIYVSYYNEDKRATITNYRGRVKVKYKGQTFEVGARQTLIISSSGFKQYINEDAADDTAWVYDEIIFNDVPAYVAINRMARTFSYRLQYDLPLPVESVTTGRFRCKMDDLSTFFDMIGHGEFKHRFKDNLITIYR